MEGYEGGGGGCHWPGPQAGHKALHTCTSWYAYAAMSSSSTEIVTMVQSLNQCATIQMLSTYIGLYFVNT